MMSNWKMKMNILRLMIMMSICLICVYGQSSLAPAIRIGPGDMIDVTVYDSADLSGHYRVNEKGDISIPLLGLLHVQGETTDEAQTIIERKYIESNILRPGSAHVILFVSEYATQGVVIGGEVKNPGIYPSLGIRTLNDLIVQAGGITSYASSQIFIKHRDSAGYEAVIEYNPGMIPPVIPKLQVIPGDTIMIPKAGSVFVIGNVNKPGNYILDIRYTMTVEKAIAIAEGEKGASSLRRVQLIRSRASGGSTIRVVDMKQIYQGKIQDIAMQDGDILYVPRSGKKAAATQAISSMLGMGTSVVTYRASYR